MQSATGGSVNNQVDTEPGHALHTDQDVLKTKDVQANGQLRPEVPARGRCSRASRGVSSPGTGCSIPGSGAPVSRPRGAAR